MLARRVCASLIAVLPMLASCSRSGLLLDGVPDDPEAFRGSEGVDGGGSGGMTATGCSPSDMKLEKARPTVMFVLDRSQSMSSQLDTFEGPSRWSILTSALAQTLPPIDQTVEIGALFFPSGNTPAQDTSCAVPSSAALSPKMGNVKALLTLMKTTTPQGATPTAAAIDVAATLLMSVHTAMTARALVLATDGAPNCNPSLNPTTCSCVPGAGCSGQGALCLDDERTVDKLAAHQAAGLPTYVIGIDDQQSSVFSGVLDEMALAGGRPRPQAPFYYPAGSKAELNVALATIRDQVNCTYLLASPTGPQASLSISIGGGEVPFDSTGKHGWSWGSKANGEIILAPGPCKQAAAPAGIPPVAHVLCAEG